MSPKWEKGKGFFSLQTTTRAGILSWNGIYLASRKLPVSCIVSFVRLLCGAFIALASLCAVFPLLGKYFLFLPNHISPEIRIFGVVLIGIV